MKKLVTKEGKLFGIINIIDLLVLLFIIAAAAVAGMFFTGKLGAETQGSKSEILSKGSVGAIDVVFYTEEVSDFVIDKVNLVDSYAFDDACQHLLGKVTDVDEGESIIYGTNAQGATIASPKEGYSSAYITAAVPAAIRTRFGFSLNKANYGIGHTFVVRVDDAKIYMRIYDIHASNKRMRRPVTQSNEKYMEMFEA